MLAKTAESSPPHTDARSVVYSTLERERRRWPRAPLSWRVQLFSSTEKVVESMTRDLSSDGFYCLSPVPFPISERLVCILSMPAHDPHSKHRDLPLHCRVRVVRIDAGGEEGMVGIACRIEDYQIPSTDNKEFRR